MQVNLQSLTGPCGCGKAHEIKVKEILLESGAVREIAGVLARCSLLGQAGLIVCDANTEPYARQVSRQAQGLGIVCLHGEQLHANEHAVNQVRAAMEKTEYAYLIAVGSGTVHDTTRFTAYEKGLPFVSFPTAASVDGFVSTVAAMTWGGFKRTFPACSPVAVVADTDIFSAAPYRLTASGVSDLLGKYTALADWEISRLVTGEYYCEQVAALMREALEIVVSNLDAVRQKEKTACEQLMYALLLSGLAMQMVGNSRPASGAEHHMSHLWEMEVLSPPLDALHGEKVGVALCYVCERYHQIGGLPELTLVERYGGMPEEKMRRAFGALYDSVLEENSPDPLCTVDLDAFREAFPKVRQVIERVPTAQKIRGMLSQAGARSTLGEINLGEDILEDSLQLSPYVRARMTLMRLSKLIRETD